MDKDSDPFSVCTDPNTFTAYRLTLDHYNQLFTSKDPKNSSILCSDELLNKNRMNVFTNFITYSKNLWESANCDSCYNDSTSKVQKFSNGTEIFLSSYQSYEDCTRNKSRINTSAVCTDCDADYQTLNSIYERLKKSTNNKVCFDLDDKVR